MKNFRFFTIISNNNNKIEVSCGGQKWKQQCWLEVRFEIQIGSNNHLITLWPIFHLIIKYPKHHQTSIYH